MEKSQDHARSEKHRKYLIQVHLNATAYYLVWGTDMSDTDKQDKLLLDTQQQMLLFTRVDQIPEMITQAATLLFDEQNLIPWASSLTASDLYTTYDLDYINSLVASDLKQEQILQSPDITHEMINFINLFGDYVYQVEQDHLVKLHRKRQIRLFFDYCYDTYFWTIPDDELQRRQSAYLKGFRFTRFKADMKQMLSAFSAYARILP